MPKTTNTPKSRTSQTRSAVTADPNPADAYVIPAVVAHHEDVTRFRGAAGAVPLDRVRTCNVNAMLAYHNAMAGRDALLAVRSDLDARGVPVDWDRIGTIQPLARAVVYAADSVAANPRESSDVATLLAEARPLRRQLLASARSFALNGRCSAAEVDRIAAGRGAVDTAKDLVDLARLHAAHGLVGPGGAITTAQVARAEFVGKTLREKIRPRGLGRPSVRTDPQRAAVDLRDRLWTVLVETYALVEGAGGFVWGRRMPAHIPALNARTVPRAIAPKAADPVAPTG